MSGSADCDQFSSMTELTEWEKINQILKRHGCTVGHVSRDPLSGAVVLDRQASLALRTAIKSLVEDTERRQNLIRGLIQSNKQMKYDARMQQDRAGRQEQRAEELQRILDSVKSKVQDLEDDFIRKMRLQEEKEAAREHCQKHEEKLREQEQSIAQLRKRLSQAAAAEEKRRKTFLQLVKRQPQRNSHLDQQILCLIDGYESQVKRLQHEIRKDKSLEDPVLERNQSGGSLDLNTTPNYKALIKSYQEQIQEAWRKEERLLQENGRLCQEMEARPSVREFRVYKQQMKKMEKILLQNNLSRCQSVTHKEAELHRAQECLPDEECQRHLQDVCRELGVQDLKDLLPVSTSKFREADACCRLFKTLSDISAVLCGPRAPPLLYKQSSRLQENRGPDTRDESEFLHLLPTIELWAEQLLSLQALHRSLRKLSHKLQPSQQQDGSEEAAGGVRVEELLLLVDTMLEDVETQRQCPQGSSSISPHVLQALIWHFQKLFDVPSVSGIYPCMNDIYSKLGEMSNALRNLRCLLGLDDTASTGTVVNAVGRLRREMEEESGHRLQQILGTLDIDSIINKVQEHEEFFPAFEELIKELLEVLGIGHLEEILPEVQRLKGLEAQ